MSDPSQIRPVPPSIQPYLPPFIATPERREEFEKDMVHVGKVSGEIAVIARVLPHPVLRMLAFGLVGLEYDPHESKLNPTKAVSVNAAPAPVGFAEAKTYGLAPNWWLPSGTTDFIPAYFDRFKLASALGIPQQRVEDIAVNTVLAERAEVSRYLTGLAALENESDETLRAVSAGQGGFSRAGVIFGTSGVDYATLRSAADATLAVRAAQNANQLPPGTVREVIRQIQADGSALNAVGNMRDGTFPPLATRPGNTMAMANADRANGIRRELVTERADP